MGESPLLVKTYDFIKWLLPVTDKFPKSQRFVMAQRVQQAAFRFYELAIEARHVRPNAPILVQADVELDKLTHYLRLCHELGLMGIGQYGYASQSVVELGKLLGGWMKKDPGRKPKQAAVPAESSAVL